MTRQSFWRLLFAVTMVTTPLIARASGPLILTSPPRETPAAGKKLYDPLAKELSQLVGKKVVYQYPGLYLGDWGTYSRRMQQGRYDFVFDGPQFVAWRIKYLKNIPLVRLPGHISYVVATLSRNITSIHQLVSNQVCAIDSPNLLTLAFLAKFSNPMQQPIIVAIDSGGMSAIYAAQQAGQCKTAIYRNSYFQHHLSSAQRAQLKVIFKSSLDLPNQTLTASPRISAAARARIIAALTTTKGSTPLQGMIRRFAKGARHFIAANPAEYQDLTSLLTPLGPVSGWVPAKEAGAR